MPAHCCCGHIYLLIPELSCRSFGLDVKHNLFQILKIKVKQNAKHSSKLFMNAVSFHKRFEGDEKGFYTDVRPRDSSHKRDFPAPKKSLWFPSDFIPHSRPSSLLTPLTSLLPLLLQRKQSHLLLIFLLDTIPWSSSF